MDDIEVLREYLVEEARRVAKLNCSDEVAEKLMDDYIASTMRLWYEGEWQRDTHGGH
jgi:hypothetical protein